MTLKETKEFTEWLMRCICYWLIAIAIVGAIINATVYERDNSDEPHSFQNRSGMKIRTDYMTGCEYFEASGGGITPRVNGHNVHIGCKQ